MMAWKRFFVHLYEVFKNLCDTSLFSLYTNLQFNFQFFIHPNTRSLVHEVQYNYIQLHWFTDEGHKKEKQNTANAKRGKINT